MLQGNGTEEGLSEVRRGWGLDTALGTVKTGREHRRSQAFRLLASCWKDLLSFFFCEVQCKISCLRRGGKCPDCTVAFLQT